MSDRRRNLWPLPGGTGAYVSNLRAMVAAARGGIARPDLEALVVELAPNVRSTSTVRGYASVPVTLGLIQRGSGDHLSATPPGTRFARVGDLAVLRLALVERVFGAVEVLEELQVDSATCPEITERLAERGISWNHPMAVRYRVWWLVAAGAIESKRESRVDRLTLTRSGRRLLSA